MNDAVLRVTLEREPSELAGRDMSKGKVGVSGQEGRQSLAGEPPCPDECHALGLGRSLGSVATR